MKYVIASLTVAAAIATNPASAARMACTAENMTKTSTDMTTMQDSPNRRAMDKEMGMANTEMSNGNMRAACSHYGKAQKMGAMKPVGMKGM